ncbi:MAG: hypothetical protein ACN0LA_05300 [Candidatus Longimicrobiales bacterium M2_2A_002]
MERRIVPRMVLALAVVLGACAAGTELEAVRSDLTVEARPGVLVLHNTGARTVRYVGLVSGALAQVTEPDEWPEIGSGATVELPNEELIAYTSQTTRATILWTTGDQPPASIEVELR